MNATASDFVGVAFQVEGVQPSELPRAYMMKTARRQLGRVQR